MSVSIYYYDNLKFIDNKSLNKFKDTQLKIIKHSLNWIPGLVYVNSSTFLTLKQLRNVLRHHKCHAQDRRLLKKLSGKIYKGELISILRNYTGGMHTMKFSNQTYYRIDYDPHFFYFNNDAGCFTDAESLIKELETHPDLAGSYEYNLKTNSYDYVYEVTDKVRDSIRNFFKLHPHGLIEIG